MIKSSYDDFLSVEPKRVNGGSVRSAQINGRRRGRPREGEAPDPQTIESIALLHFATAGYEATSIRAIAALANIDPALISRRYGSKMGLWLATVDAVSARLNTLYDVMRGEIEGEGPFLPRFRAAIRHFIAFNCEIPEASHFFLNELNSPGGRRDYVTSAIWQPYLKVMQRLFDEADKRGVCRLVDRALAPASFLGMIVMPHLVAPVLESELSGDSPTLVDRIMASVDAALINASGTAAALEMQA